MCFVSTAGFTVPCFDSDYRIVTDRNVRCDLAGFKSWSSSEACNSSNTLQVAALSEAFAGAKGACQLLHDTGSTPLLCYDCAGTG